MNNLNIKEMVKDGKRVQFCHYKHGELFYKTECGFMFPVPISDTGDGVFLNEDKAMLFMRYIRKQIEAIKSANQEFGSIKDCPPLSVEEGVKSLRDSGILDENNNLSENYR